MSKDMIIQGVNEDLKKVFKTACSHFGLSMKIVLIKHMENIVNDYRKDVLVMGPPRTYTKRKEKK